MKSKLESSDDEPARKMQCRPFAGIIRTERNDRARRRPARLRMPARGAGGKLGGLRQMRFLRNALAAVAALFLVAGCAAAPEKPTIVVLSLTAAPDVNPDASGRPSPVVVRIYQLASPTAFAAADFFQPYQQEAAVL